MTQNTQQPSATIRLLQALRQEGSVGGEFEVSFANPLSEAIVIREAKLIIRWAENMTPTDDGVVIYNDYPVAADETVSETVRHTTRSPDYSVPPEAQVCFYWTCGEDSPRPARAVCGLD